MNFYGNPVLKIRTKDRLHITKEPGLVSWAMMMVFSIAAFALNYYFIPDYFILPAAFLTLCLLFSLNLMETWDFIMDKEENLVTLVNRSWYHGFSMKVPEENVKRFPLSCISSVIAKYDKGIEIVKKDGSRMLISSESQDFRSLSKLRREIATFLHLERIEYLIGNDMTFYSWDDWLENHDTDAETLNSNLNEQEASHEFGRNIKVIAGPL